MIWDIGYPKVRINKSYKLWKYLNILYPLSSLVHKISSKLYYISYKVMKISYKCLSMYNI